MHILALETSSRQGSLALFDGASCLGEETWTKSQSHSETVTLSIEKLLKSCQRDFSDLKLIAVGRGPGSFTGIRIGVSIAKTLGCFLSIPTWGEDSLRVLAHQVPRMNPKESTLILCLQNAFGSEFFSALFQADGGRLETLRSPQSTTVEALVEELRSFDQPVVCLGEGYSLAKSFLPEELLEKLIRRSEHSDFPHAHDLGPLALRAAHENMTYEWNQLQPLYLRASAAEEKLKQGLLKPLPKL